MPLMTTEVLPDEKSLRYGRRARAFAAMEEHDLDVLVLGRMANVRYLIGAPMLWNAGTRAFAPICVVVRASEDIHLMSTWDEGIPEEIPRSNFIGITWNPMNFLSWLQNIDGAAAARRVGIDSVSPFFEQMLPVAFPAADIVDGEHAIQAARRIKTAEEVAAIRASLAVAEGALAATVAELRPGIHERELTGVFMEAMASLGVTTPSRQDVVSITSRQATRAPKGQERVQAGDLVAFSAGVLDGGYTGEVGRTWPVGSNGEVAAHRALYQRWDELWVRLLEACRPGASGADLLAAYETAGVPLPAVPIARGVGLGLDVPVVVADLPATAKQQRLEPGVVLAVTGVVESDVGAVIGQEVVLITDDGAQTLSSSPFWNH
jgi:Xaa-Pro dipeptidase